jgi:transglutaminase-like putative cysteine protease
LDLFGGNARGNSPAQNGEANTLEGVPAGQWNNGTRTGQEAGRQYAVMIVKSAIDPVYAADAYYGKLDPQRGFEKTPNQPLNDLTYRHLLETWKASSIPQDLGRRQNSISFLSTLPERVLAYLPYSVEPTVLNSQYYPFSYSYASVSLMEVTNPRRWLSIPELSGQEKQALSPYLQVPLAPKDKRIFQRYLNGVLAKAASSSGSGRPPGYFAKLIDILRSFSTFQYKIGVSDSGAIAHLENFLTKTKNGDCVEFSNSTAILARLAGIPARVVTGYLAAKQLQTPAHIRGLAILRSEIKPLQKYPMNELYLVTTADAHAWVQVWLPRYGWVDIETTSFAIPPAAGGDPNNWNVVIPLINGQRELTSVFHFPWDLVLRILVFAIAFTFLVIYLYRYGREIFLLNLSRGRDKRALEALHKLLLLRLIANDYDLKAPSQTPREYAKRYPELSRFADLYTELRYRENFSTGQYEKLWREIKSEYRKLMRNCRKAGLVAGLRRAFGLRGLYYRW